MGSSEAYVSRRHCHQSARKSCRRLVVESRRGLGLDVLDHALHQAQGAFLPRTRRTAKRLRSAAFVYAGVMIVRYLVAPTLGETPHWYSGGLIPVSFHLVLATFLFLAGSGSGRGALDGGG